MDEPRPTPIDPFLAMAALFLTAGLVALAGRLAVDLGLLAGVPRPRWTTIHLVTIGGVTQALFGALPRLVAERGGPAPDGPAWSRWASLNVGFLLVLVGLTSGSTAVAVAGAAGVLVALVALGLAVWRSGTAGAGRAFRIAPWFLAVGILAALGMLTGTHGPGGYFGSLEAHVHANVWGFLGLTAAGALALLVPRLVGRPLPFDRWEPWWVAAIAAGALGLVAGPWLAVHALTFGGLLLYLAGTVVLLANVVEAWRRAGDLGPRAGHVLGAYLWLLFPVPWAPFVLLAPELVDAVAIERAAIDGLVFGWMLQLAAAFLPTVVVGTSRTGLDVAATLDVVPPPSWGSVVSINLGVLALWTTAMPVLPGVDARLGAAGLSLVGLGWALFLRRLWGVVARTSVVSPSIG